jgi:hypothetical protein
MKNWIPILCCTVLIATALIFIVFREVQAEKERRAVIECANEIQLAIERWGVDHKDFYPATFSVLTDLGYKLPMNQFTASPMRELDPRDPAAPGDFRYIPLWGEFEYSDGTTSRGFYYYYVIVYLHGQESAAPRISSRLGPIGAVIRKTGSKCYFGDNALEVLQSKEESLDEALDRLGYPQTAQVPANL